MVQNILNIIIFIFIISFLIIKILEYFDLFSKFDYFIIIIHCILVFSHNISLKNLIYIYII